MCTTSKKKQKKERNLEILTYTYVCNLNIYNIKSLICGLIENGLNWVYMAMATVIFCYYYVMLTQQKDMEYQKERSNCSTSSWMAV